MFIPTLLLAACTAQGGVPSILGSVPDEAYSLVTCSDVEGFRQRVEKNDWMRLSGSEMGPLMHEAGGAWRDLTRTEMGTALEVAARLSKETVFFQTKEVWGFTTEPPLDRTDLAAAMRAWLPKGGAEQQHVTADVLGARVEMVAWMGETTAYNPREGHFAAFVDAPGMMGLFSADDAKSLMRVARASIVGSGTDHRAPLVKGFLAARTARGARGIEAYVDFTPFVAEAEEQLAREVRDVFPDPTGLLGLERGTWLYAAFDVERGTRAELTARLHIPKDTLAARLADTFRPLPHGTPGEVPKDTWMVHALNWDVHEMYSLARAAVIAKHGEDSLKVVDSGLEVAEAMSGVDPEVAILQQLSGTFSLFLAPDPLAEGATEAGDEPFEELLSLGLAVGVVDADAFLETLETLIGIGGIEAHLTSTEVEGAEAWLMSEPDESFDGGFALLPRSFVIGLSRGVLAKSLRALNGVDGASLLSGSRLAGGFDENIGACYVSCIELGPMRSLALQDGRRPAHSSGKQEEATGATAAAEPPASDPFDSLLINAVKRTKDGFELKMYTR